MGQLPLRALRSCGRRLLLAVLLCAGTWSLALAQHEWVLDGFVRDSSTGETLIGATIRLSGSPIGVASNRYGFYSLRLPEGRDSLVVSYLGYRQQVIPLEMHANRSVNVLMVPVGYQGKGIVVHARRKDENIQAASMGSIRLGMAQIKSLPALFGEVDPMKALQLLPGVQSAGEGNAGLYIRGGSPDQNLILLDEAPVYNTGHLFGFFSVFNADAIQNVTLIKGGVPAFYGGRLSSVVDVQMKDGDNQQWKAEGGIGLIASRFSVEGPLQKGKSSLMISARRTYVDVLVKPFVSKSSSFHGSGYYFYDLNAKFNDILSEKDRLYVSGYFGRDVFKFLSSERNFSTTIPWGNATATLRWNHIFSPKLFANTTLIYNDYRFSFRAVQNNLDLSLNSGIVDGGVRMDFDYYPVPSHHIKFGIQETHHTFIPSIASGKSGDNAFSPDNPYRKYAWESAAYVQDEWTPNSHWNINVGLRYSLYQQLGPYRITTQDSTGTLKDSLSYRPGQLVASYGALEPRLLIDRVLNPESSIKASVTRQAQYVHLVSNSGSTLPTDLWVPSTLLVKPQASWEYSLGYYRNFRDNTYETSLEVYYRTMSHQIQYKSGYVPSLADPETQFTFGRGWAYGAELYIHKQLGRLTGWVGYTLAWTWLKFPDLNGGLKFPAKYDRRHDLSVVGSYHLNASWDLSADFVFGTGNAVTLPERFYFIEGVLSQAYSSLDSYRMKPYDRLDLAATLHPAPKPGRRWSHSWTFSVYNVYSRLNPYFIYFNQQGSYIDGSLQVQAKKVALFPVLPSVTWNFSF